MIGELISLAQVMAPNAFKDNVSEWLDRTPKEEKKLQARPQDDVGMEFHQLKMDLMSGEHPKYSDPRQTITAEFKRSSTDKPYPIESCCTIENTNRSFSSMTLLTDLQLNSAVRLIRGKGANLPQCQASTPDREPSIFFETTLIDQRSKGKKVVHPHVLTVSVPSWSGQEHFEFEFDTIKNQVVQAAQQCGAKHVILCPFEWEYYAEIVNENPKAREAILSSAARSYAKMVIALREAKIIVGFSDLLGDQCRHEFWDKVNEQLGSAPTLLPIADNADIGGGWAEDHDMIFNLYDSKTVHLGGKSVGNTPLFNDRLGLTSTLYTDYALAVHRLNAYFERGMTIDMD